MDTRLTPDVAPHQIYEKPNGRRYILTEGGRPLPMVSQLEARQYDGEERPMVKELLRKNAQFYKNIGQVDIQPTYSHAYPSNPMLLLTGADTARTQDMVRREKRAANQRRNQERKKAVQGLPRGPNAVTNLGPTVSVADPPPVVGPQALFSLSKRTAPATSGSLAKRPKTASSSTVLESPFLAHQNPEYRKAWDTYQSNWPTSLPPVPPRKFNLSRTLPVVQLDPQVQEILDQVPQNMVEEDVDPVLLDRLLKVADTQAELGQASQELRDEYERIADVPGKSISSTQFQPHTHAPYKQTAR